MNEVLKTFLKEGQLAFIHYGISLQSVHDQLGVAEGYSLASRRPKIVIYKYEGLELTFTEEILTSIKLNFLADRLLPDIFSKEEVTISMKTSLYEMIKLLNVDQIAWEIDPHLSLGHQVNVKTVAGVSIVFDLDYLELHAMYQNCEIS